MRSIFLVILSLWLVIPPAQAWHSTGHKLTADIAYHVMSEEQREHIASVMRAHPRFDEDFAAAMPDNIAAGSGGQKVRWIMGQASIWPDLVPNISESVRTQYHRGTWHYINMPVYLTAEDEKELSNSLDHNMSTTFEPPLRQNLNIIQALKGNLLVWRDQTASDSDKAVALCWIIHLTGDLHQPLHNVALFSRAFFPEGDRGGNSIAIKREDKDANLHAVWDGLAFGSDDLTPNANSKALLAKDKYDFASIDGWAVRHYQMAMDFVYTEEVRTNLLGQVSNRKTPEISLSPEYLLTARSIAMPQVIIAGHRIAALIMQ